jgi:hypothetical protein
MTVVVLVGLFLIPNAQAAVMKHSFIVFLSLLVFFGCSKSKKETSKHDSASADASGLQLFQQGDEFGYRDIIGQIAIKPQFAEAGEFSEGLARAKRNAGSRWGYINSAGDEVIAPQFDGASDFHDGKAVIQSGEKFMYIGPDGKSLGLFEDAPPYREFSAGDTLFVIHPNGLIARALGDMSSEAVGEVQFGEPVEYVYDPHPRQEQTIEGLRGAWLAVRFQGKRGYLFDVYLSRFPQTEEKRVVESYKVVVSSANNENYSTYTLTKYLSRGRAEIHEGLEWAESQEIVPASTVDQVIARMKLFPSGEVGAVVSQFNGDSGTFTTQSGDNVVIVVRRDSGGFFDHVTFARKTEEENLDVSISRYSFHDVEITIASTPTESQDQTE